MTHIPPERTAALLGLLRQDLLDENGKEITTWTNADRSYCCGRTDELDFTDAKWTGMLLERLQKRCLPHNAPPHISEKLLNEFTIALRNYLFGGKNSKLSEVNTALITALDSLEDK